MTGREFKDFVYQHFAGMAHAFSSPKRLEIIDVLAQGERDVESLAGQVSMTVANTSRHLQVLKGRRLVEARREGVKIFYRLADDLVVDCWQRLQRLSANRLAEIREIERLFHEERDDLEPVTVEELWRRIQESGVTVIDVRPAEEYQHAHLPGAISIPLPDLLDRIREIPEGRGIVAYCRGPYCVLSAEAVSILRDYGFRAARMKEGVPEWKRAGLPVESGRVPV
jgi:rhodanese-related sulfurtransferase